MQDSYRVLYLSVYIVTFVTGLPANALAFYTFCKKVRQRATPIDILLLNLTISDLLFLLFLPFKMQEVVNNMMWDIPYALCSLSSFFFFMTIYNSTFFLTAISVERYLGVAFPIQHSLKRRPIYAVAASIFFWILSFLHLSIVLIMPIICPESSNSSNSTNNVSDHESMSPASDCSNSISNSSILKDRSILIQDVCYKNFTPCQLNVLLPVRLELCLVLFCIPFLISSFCYINFIRILSRLQHIGRRRRLRAIGMALGTLLVFALCFGPYNISHVVGYVTKKDPKWRDKALLCSTFNACLDPLIFYFSSSAVRGAVGSMMEATKSWLNTCMCCNTLWFPCKRVDEMAKDKAPKQEESNAI